VRSPERSQRAETFSGSCLYKPPVAVGVGPVGEAFGPEFAFVVTAFMRFNPMNRVTTNVPHPERLLDELGVLGPHVVQGGQEERRDAPLIPLPLGEVR
jgi:hypothetical protein